MDFMKSSRVTTLALGVLALSGGLAMMRVQAAPPAPMGKITPWAAIKIATAKVPGHATQANFEFDEGKWVYGVMIVTPQGFKEVEIDPMTGKIGDTEVVDPAGEAKEVEQEMNAALKAAGVTQTHAAAGDKPEAGEKN